MTIISKELIRRTFDSVRANFPSASTQEVCAMVAVNLCTDIETVKSVLDERKQVSA